MKRKPFYFANDMCDWYVGFLWMTLVIWKPPYDLRNWGFDADGAFAICAPWFLFYPW